MPKQLLLIALVIAVLLYMRYESNHEKVDQALLQEAMNKPIDQIERELNPGFVQMVRDAEESNESQ